MSVKTDFYKKCLDMGYTNINDSEQHKQIELMAMEKNIDYADIESYYRASKEEYLMSQKVEEEKAKKRIEEKERKAVNGNWLCTVETPRESWYVYKRPNGSIYSEKIGNDHDRYEGISFSVKDHYDSLYTYTPSKTIYTGATVGGVTTGGVDTIPGGYDFKSRKTNKAFIEVKIGNNEPTIVINVQLSELGAYLFSDKYSSGQIACLNVDSYKRNKELVKRTRSGNMYEQFNQTMSSLSMVAYPKETCENRCEFINWYTQHFFPLNKDNPDSIYKAADELSKNKTYDSLLTASKMFLFIKDYKDAADRAIETRNEYTPIKTRYEQQRMKQIEEKRKMENLTPKLLVAGCIILFIIFGLQVLFG